MIRPRPTARAALIAAVLVLALTLCACPPKPQPTAARSVLLLPFVNAADPAHPGPERMLLYDALQLLLPQVDGVLPLDLQRTIAARNRAPQTQTVPADPARLAALGRESDADYLIVGSYRSDLNHTELGFLFVDCRDGRQQRWSGAGFLENVHLIGAAAIVEFARFIGRDPSRALWELANAPDPLTLAEHRLPQQCRKLFVEGRDSDVVNLCDSMLTRDPRNLFALTMVARVSLRNGDLQLAGELVQMAMGVAEEIGDDAARAELLDIGGQIMSLSADREAAEMMLFNSLELATALDDRELQGRVICDMADLYARDGRLDRAQELSQRAVKLLEATPFHTQRGDAELNLAAVEIELGRPRRALARLRLADEDYVQADNNRSRALVAKIRGDLRREEGDLNRALDDYTRARDLALISPNLLLLAHVYNDMAAIELRLERPAVAAWHFSAAEGLAAALGMSELERIARQGRETAQSRLGPDY
ncbi:MAG: hypothetical protein P9M14_02415 [Candidatus Alcyoniella australis]|nr:hypothetical protein [Candidatus Alcyoniella australis]